MAAAACVRGPGGWLPTYRASAEVKIVESTAVPTAPPICWLVLTIAEPTPASSPDIPAVAVTIAGAKVIPTPNPSTMIGASTPPAYVEDSVRWRNQNMPTAAVIIPAGTSGRGP